ncbi:hypothetical protein [Succinivibrio sp.]
MELPEKLPKPAGYLANAISLKNSFGFKKIWDMNLFLAKQKYPEEF